MTSDSGTLQKLYIEAYLDPEQENKDSDNFKFEAYYNPSSLQMSYGIDTNEEEAQGQGVKLIKYKGHKATTYSFELLLDGTGASIPNGISKDQPGGDGKKISVREKVKQFKDVAYEFRGDNHEGPYLRLSWGETALARVILTSLGVTYDLFAPNGEPLRAKLSCQFTEYSYEVLANAQQNPQSPDVTHQRVVKQGDRLPLMCERIYGDATLYQQVARYNGLTNFRNLVPGQKIYFPPLTNSKN